MRTSQRKQIRQYLVSLLKTPPITGIGDNVFSNRARLIFPQKLPCILIYSRNEPAEKFVEAPREYKRRLNIEIEIQAKLNDDVDDALDDLAEEVERRVLKDPNLNNLASDTFLDDTEMEIVQQGNDLHGALRLTFVVEYNQPVEYDEAVDVFETAHVEITTKPDGGQDPVVQDIELPQ